MSNSPSLSLYLHIPFCRHRCSYCDFNTYTSVGELKTAYADALSREIQQVSGAGKRAAHTVYLGGGTPSLMPPNTLEKILHSIRAGFILSEDAELSLEANPDTVDAEYLQAIQKLGLNRLSFGAQSADDGELALLGRDHEFGTVARAVDLSRAAGFENINLDLIYGLPGQSLASWERSLRLALDLHPDHLSLYCLTIEPGTPMHRWLESGRIQSPNPDLAADQYEFACSLLSDAGFVHYEISNWSLPGRECVHNLSYWRNDEYLGLGAGAHGHASGFRYWVVKQPRVYLRRMADMGGAQFPWSAAVAGKKQLSRREAISDTMITQLRLLEEGLDMAAFENKFGLSPQQTFPGIIEQMLDYGLLYIDNGRLLLSKRGQFLSNQVFHRFM